MRTNARLVVTCRRLGSHGRAIPPTSCRGLCCTHSHATPFAVTSTASQWTPFVVAWCTSKRFTAPCKCCTSCRATVVVVKQTPRHGRSRERSQACGYRSTGQGIVLVMQKKPHTHKHEKHMSSGLRFFLFLYSSYWIIEREIIFGCRVNNSQFRGGRLRHIIACQPFGFFCLFQFSWTFSPPRFLPQPWPAKTLKSSSSSLNHC